MSMFMKLSTGSTVFSFATSAAVLFPIVASQDAVSQSTLVNEQDAPEDSIVTAISMYLEVILSFVGIAVVLGLNKYHYRHGRGSNAKLRKVTTKVVADVTEAKLKKGLPQPKSREVPQRLLEAAQDTSERKRSSDSLQAATKKDDAAEAVSILETMEAKSGAPFSDYSCVITCCARTGDAQAAEKWLRRALEIGHPPTHISFNAVVNALAKVDIWQALRVTDDMRAAGLEFDTITYNTIIGAWARNGDAVNSQLWMKMMLTAGVKASVVSFGSVMRACAAAGQIQNLDDWLEKSKVLGIELNLICYSSVINALAKRDNMEGAVQWLSRMLASGLQPDITCFTGVLDVYLTRGELQAATKIVELMRSVSVEPDSGIFSSVVAAAVNCGDRHMAQKWADECYDAPRRRLTRAAEMSLISIRLRVPNFKKSRKELAEAQEARGVSTAAPISKVQAPARNSTIGDPEELANARKSVVGQKFIGTIKEFVSGKFGYIVCDETHVLFHRDVYMSSSDNPEQLAKGQKVSFTLRVDAKVGLPRAADVEVYRLNT